MNLTKFLTETWNVLAQIFDLNSTNEPLDGHRHLYLCGFECERPLWRYTPRG